MSDDKRLIWIDLEMTGLDPETHVVIEIASIVTDGQINIIDQGPVIPINYPAEALATIDEWSLNHHRSSGLMERVEKSEYDCRTAEAETLEFLSRHCRQGESPLCGNSVWQDRRFLIKYMPTLEAFLHYRNIDVSTLKELVRLWYPDLEIFEKETSHLALNDIKESIEELVYYRDQVFKSHSS